MQATLESALSKPTPDETDESLKGLEVRFEKLPRGYFRVKLYRNGVEVLPERFSLSDAYPQVQVMLRFVKTTTLWKRFWASPESFHRHPRLDYTGRR